MNLFSKILFSSLVLVLLLLSQGFAQSPEALKYQAVLRDVNNAPITWQNVGIRISILQDSPTGPTIYQETHSPTTSAIGLIALNIGQGTVYSGAFSDIDWGEYEHFLQVEVDESGGTSYYVLGTSQLLSVPYALFADKAGAVDLLAGDGISINDNEISNAAPSLWELDSTVVSVDSNQVGIGFSASDSIPFPEDARLFVNGNVRMADDSALLGVGTIAGAQGLRLLGNPGDEPDMEIFSTGRVRFEQEVGINQVFSFIDLNVRNQAGNSTVFQVEDTSGSDLFEVGRTGNVGINQITNNVTLQVQNRDTTGGITNNIIANFERANGDNVLQIQDDQDVVVTGDFSVNSGNKNFIMDHPLDPENMVLAHNAVESPDHVTYY
ncbi:MAG: hypothetical protein AAF399_19690, partial [Bacteroidota bacterium]